MGVKPSVFTPYMKPQTFQIRGNFQVKKTQFSRSHFLEITSEEYNIKSFLKMIWLVMYLRFVSSVSDLQGMWCDFITVPFVPGAHKNSITIVFLSAELYLFGQS